MSHTDPMIMALRALGEPAGSAHDDEHARTCAHCRHELARLTELVDLARTPGPVEALEQPPPAIWDRIAAAVGDITAPASGTASASGTATASGTASANGTAPLNGTSPVHSDRGSVTGIAHGGRRGIRGRRRLTVAVAGLAAGLIIGVGGTAGIVQLTRAPATRVVAQIELSPLAAFPQWQGATGTAVMRAGTGQQTMVVTLHAPQRPGFYEVWLLARNGVSMISLGDLNADHTGTFTVPPGTNLDNYSRIDISLQPFNGSTVHAKTSVVRGSLPAVALGSGAGSASGS